jgi:hypothetical protein
MLKKLIFAAATLMIATPVLAHDRDDDRGWGHRHGHWKHHYYQPQPVFVMPPPRVYYAPPAPVYVAPPAPVYLAPPQSGVSIRFHFPL